MSGFLVGQQSKAILVMTYQRKRETEMLKKLSSSLVLALHCAAGAALGSHGAVCLLRHITDTTVFVPLFLS